MPFLEALSPEARESMRERARLAARRKAFEWFIMAACVAATLAVGWLFRMPLL